VTNLATAGASFNMASRTAVVFMENILEKDHPKVNLLNFYKIAYLTSSKGEAQKGALILSP
jgi:hypothetical protein